MEKFKSLGLVNGKNSHEILEIFCMYDDGLWKIIDSNGENLCGRVFPYEFEAMKAGREIVAKKRLNPITGGVCR